MIFLKKTKRKKNNIIHEQQGKPEDSVVYIYIIYSTYIPKQFIWKKTARLSVLSVSRCFLLSKLSKWFFPSTTGIGFSGMSGHTTSDSKQLEAEVMAEVKP